MAFDAVPWILDSSTIDAEVIRRALGTLIGSSGGVVTPGDLTVTQNGTPNMSVNVGTGEIWVPGTSTASQGPYYGRNGASVNVPIAAADATNPRIDTIVVQVEDPEYGGSGSPMAPMSLKGTATAGATLANLTGKATVPVSAYVLAYVLVPANATSIVTADISNISRSAAQFVQLTPALAGSGLAVNAGYSSLTGNGTPQVVAGVSHGLGRAAKFGAISPTGTSASGNWFAAAYTFGTDPDGIAFTAYNYGGSFPSGSPFFYNWFAIG